MQVRPARLDEHVGPRQIEELADTVFGTVDIASGSTGSGFGS